MRIFVSHGRDELAKLKLKDFLQQAGHIPVILGEQPGRQGLTIIEALERFSLGCEFAVILLTADDKTFAGEHRARQNVIHEIGFFQGQLGRDRVVLIIKFGVEIPSNLSGWFYLEYRHEVREIYTDLRIIVDSGTASKSAREVPDEWERRKDMFDRYFPEVQTFLRDIIAYKLEVGNLMQKAKANQDKDEGDVAVAAIVEMDHARANLMTSYMIRRHFLGQSSLRKVERLFNRVKRTAERRAVDEGSEWTSKHLNEAMIEYKEYLEAFEAFVWSASAAFESVLSRCVFNP